MANPTTNFGWVMPTSSSLVTNLPADFNTFGQAVDTSMSELLGGTTGQVLSKTSNTNMDFTWVTPTDQTPLTTKGDLFTFTTVDARLAVGNNGETLVADSSATTGLRWQAPKTQNAVYNSGFDVWQRGTSVATGNGAAGAAYTADRWQSVMTSGAMTTSRQATGDTTNLPNIQYCARVQRNSGSTNTNIVNLIQSLETTDSIRFTGQTITLSFYARAGANFSSASSALGVNLYYGTGTDQNVIYTFTGATAVIATTKTLTTTWQRFTATATVATASTEIGYWFNYTPVGTAGANDYFEITGVQLEVGSQATPFNRQSGTIQGELAACQRYYYRWSAANLSTAYIANGANLTTSGSYAIVKMPVTMRSNPTLETSGTASNYRIYNGGTSQTCTSVPAIDQSHPDTPAVSFTAAGLLTVGYATYIGANSTTAAFLGFNSEL